MKNSSALQFPLFEKLVGLPELEYLFEKIRKNSKLSFIDDSLFNFKYLTSRGDGLISPPFYSFSS